MKIVNYLMMILLAFSLGFAGAKSCTGQGCEEVRLGAPRKGGRPCGH